MKLPWYPVLLVGSLSGLQHCLNEEYVLYRFELDSCPDEAFTLPDSVAHYQSVLSSMDSGRNYPDCPGFKLYDFRERRHRGIGIGQTGIYVKLNRGPSCVLDVVFRFDRRDEEPIRWAEAVAELTMQGSTARPSIPAASKENLGFFEDFKTWCARRADGVERKCDDIR